MFEITPNGYLSGNHGLICIFCLFCFAEQTIHEAEFRTEEKEGNIGAFHLDPASISLRTLCLKRFEQMRETPKPIQKYKLKSLHTF